MCNLEGIEHHRSHVMPNPIIHFSSLSKHDREDLRAKMNELTEKIENEFCKFQKWVLECIVGGKIDCNTLVATLRNEVQFTDEVKAEVDVFMKIIPSYCSYFNYGLLEKIVDVYGLDKAPLEKYLSAFSQYCQAIPCIETVCGNESTTPGRTTVDFKLKGLKRDILKPDHVQSIKRKIASHLGVKYSALYLLFVKKGCVLLVFLVPDFIVKRSFPLSDKQKIALYTELNVMSVTIHCPNLVQVYDIVCMGSHCSQLYMCMVTVLYHYLHLDCGD